MNQAERDDQASRIIADCLQRADGGTPVDPDEVIARYPECAAELRSYFANEHLLGNALGKLAAADQDNAVVPVSEQPTVSPGAGDSVPSGAPSFRKLPTEFGRYRVERILGQGAMGAVYLAHDTNLGRDVALKTPKLGDVPDAEAVERFRREARAAAVLHHRNLCPVFDVGEIQGTHFLTMAYIDGVPLSKAVSEDNPPTERQCAAVIRKLAVALQEAHSHGVVHRDLKPANILMDRSREPVIMDFGLAYQMDQADRSRLTGEGVIMGSPAYMSPEQVTGEPSAVGPLTDQYSLGVILFELLTGQLPVDGSTVAILAKILAGEQRRIQDVRPEIDRRLAGICSRMMAKQTEDRFPSMQAVADVLGRWLKDQKHTSSKTGVVEDPTSWVVLYKEPLSKDPLPPRQKKRKRRRKQSVAGTVRPDDASQPLSEPRPMPSTSPRRSRSVSWMLWLAAGVMGTAVLAGVIITLSDGTKIETTDGERVEITSNRDGSTSVTVQPANPADRSTAAATAELRSTRIPAEPGPHEILTSDDWTWSKPVFIGEFETHGNMDQVLTDDFQTRFQAMPRPGDTTEKPKRDIARFTRTAGDDRWSGPVFLDPPINGLSDERGPCVSPDGRLLVFQSDRPGGSGGRDDLWICERSSDDGEWGTPVNLGPKVNSRKWEGQACFSPDSRTIYFSSDRRRKGSHLWMTTRSSRDAAWVPAVEVPLGQNSPVRVMNPTLSSDSRIMIFTGDGEFGGEGEFDLWMCQRPSPDAAWSAPRNLGLPVNTPGHEFATAISDDGKLLLFRRIPPEGKEAEGHGYWSVRRVRKSSVKSIAGTPSAPPVTGRSGQTAMTQNTAGWTSLFNGNDLDGWDGDPRLWTVRDGVIRGETTPQNKASGNTFLVWTGGRTKDFELQLSFRCGDQNNSGIQYRSQRRRDAGAKNEWAVQGYQYEIRNQTKLPHVSGFIYDEGGLTGGRGFIIKVGQKGSWKGNALQVSDPPLITEDEFGDLFRRGDWNEVVIRASGQHIQHFLNGRLIVDFTDSMSRLLSDGILALQLHAGKPMWVEFRDIRIREVSSSSKRPAAASSLPPRQSPAADVSDDTGWTSPFNGTDLAGWHTVYSKSDVWRVEDGEIVCRQRRSGEKDVAGWLATDENYLNLELELEYNLKRDGNSGIFLRAVPGEARNGAQQLEVQLLDDNAPRFRDQLTDDKITGAVYGSLPVNRRARVQPNQWNQIAVRLVGDQITVTVNGDVVTDGDVRVANPEFFRRNQLDQPGPVGLQWHGGKVRFRNLRIRRLDADGRVIPAGEGRPGRPGPFGRGPER